jgi:outer membrane protein TolC
MKRLCLLLIYVVAGCDSSFQDIDKRVNAVMSSTSENMGAIPPTSAVYSSDNPGLILTNTEPLTINPSSEELGFTPATPLDEDEIAKSLDRAAEDLEATSELISLKESLVWADVNAREMQFAQYDYLSSTLSLLKELHVWGPRLLNTVSADVTAESTGGLYDTSLAVVNDFSITQKLENGGRVSAGALTNVARDVHSTTVNSASSSTVHVLLDIPLLKGAGSVARESLIQAKRNLVYAARGYERFRRTFYRSIVGDYLSLVVQKQSLQNAQRGVDSLRQLAERQAALYESGRTRLYDSADAENQALASVARLSQSWERYRLALDRFKIRIGWPVNSVIQVELASLGVVPPEVDVVGIVQEALVLRLDLQNEKDRVVDTQRSVENTINALLPGLAFTAKATTGSEENSPAKTSGEDVDYLAGLSLSLPLDRENERISVRQSQIALERARRTYRESRDNVAISVRSALRNIEVNQFTFELQVRNVQIAELGLNSINADPDRVSVLDQTRAISDLQSAQDARDGAKKDLELSIIDYLLQAGRLRINNDGGLSLPTLTKESAYNL